METLPPIGQITDHSGASEYLANLAKEAYSEASEWIAMADKSREVFTYGDQVSRLNTDDDALVLNEIGNAVIAISDAQTREPITVSLEGREAGEPPRTYWAGPDEVGLALGLPPQCLASWGETGQPVLPVAPDQARMIKQMSDYGVPVNTPMGPMPLDEDWLAPINDVTRAKVFQVPFDLFWQRGQIPQWFEENVLDTNAQGYSFGLIEFDDERKAPELTHLTVKQVYFDPQARSIARANYVGVDFVMDAEEAKSKYPDLADAIDAEADTGRPTQPDGANIGTAAERDYQRKMVVLRVFWLRNQVAPMELEEAKQSGIVEEREVPTGNLMPQINELTQMPMFDLTTGEPQMQPEMRQGMFMGEEELDAQMPMAHENWPVKRVIRQITDLAGQIVDDRASDFWDFPVLHNIARPVIGKPFGIGEPWFLRNLQRAWSRILHNAAVHTDQFSHPGGAVPESVIAATKAAFGEFYSDPTTVLAIPDDLYRSLNGKMDFYHEPPQFPASSLDIANILRSTLNDQSGNTSEARGQSSGAQSGRAIEMLQTAAMSMMSFKGKKIGHMATWLTHHLLHFIQTRLTLEEVCQMVTSYPPHIIEAILNMPGPLDLDIVVSISAAGGAIQSQKKAEYRADYAAGIIDLETAQEGLKYDVRRMRQRMERQQARVAQMTAAAPQGQEDGKANPAQKPGSAPQAGQ